MSTERRSAFSRAVRGTRANPLSDVIPMVTIPNRVPNATVANYSHQAALAELERSRATVAELREAVFGLLPLVPVATRYNSADTLVWMRNHDEKVFRITGNARALLAKLDSSNDGEPKNDVQAAIGGLTQTPMEW